MYLQIDTKQIIADARAETWIRLNAEDKAREDSIDAWLEELRENQESDCG